MRIEYTKDERASKRSFELPSDVEARLLVAIEEAERGETTSASHVLQQIRRS